MQNWIASLHCFVKALFLLVMKYDVIDSLAALEMKDLH